MVVIAAIDGALLRPGRLDQLLYIPLPSEASDRLAILSAVTRDMPLCKPTTQPGEASGEGAVADHSARDIVRLDELAAQTAGFSGADLRELCQQAGELALSESISRTMATQEMDTTEDQAHADDVDDVDEELDVVCQRHFEEALLTLRRSVSDAEADRYDKLCQSLRSGEAMPLPPNEEAVPPPQPTAPESPAIPVPAGRPEVRTRLLLHPPIIIQICRSRMGSS